MEINWGKSYVIIFLQFILSFLYFNKLWKQQYSNDTVTSSCLFCCPRPSLWQYALNLSNIKWFLSSKRLWLPVNHSVVPPMASTVFMGHMCPLCTTTLPVGKDIPGNCQCLLSFVEELLLKQPCWFQDPILFPKHGNKEFCIPQVWTASFLPTHSSQRVLNEINKSVLSDPSWPGSTSTAHRVKGHTNYIHSQQTLWSKHRLPVTQTLSFSSNPLRYVWSLHMFLLN